MPISDDQQFKEYLKQFRPLAPQTLQIGNQGHTTRRRAVFAAWAAATAVLIAAIIMVWPRSEHTYFGEDTKSLAELEQFTNSQPLTIGSANVLLANAPSIKAAVNLVAFHPRTTQLPKGKQSALALLSKENTLP